MMSAAYSQTITRTFRGIAMCALFLAACYPDYIRTPNPGLITAPEVRAEMREQLNKMLTECRDQLDGARKNAYELHKAQYDAGVVGSSVTMASGAAAGGLGAGEQRAWSGVSGVVSLGAGIVTLILVNKAGIADAEANQAKMMKAWDAMAEAKSGYEVAVVRGASADVQAKQLANFVEAVNKCGLQPPPGFLGQ